MENPASNEETLAEKRMRMLHLGSTGASTDPKWETPEKAWQVTQDEREGHRVFFNHITIAGDGGLSEIGNKAELWYPGRVLSSVILVLFVVYNIFFLISVDVSLIMEAKRKDEDDYHYLLSKWVMDRFMPEAFDVAHNKLIAAVELFILSYFIGKTVIRVYWAIKGDGYKRWISVSGICWKSFPNLSVFSAMKLLQYNVPQKLSYDLNYIIWYDHGSKPLNLLIFFITRPIALIIGMDCFLVKYRTAAPFIMITDPTVHEVIGAVIFLNQVLGVVNIQTTIKTRLYRFVFGGEDGIMTAREINRMKVWEAMVAFHIFERYPLQKAIPMMLAWCDDDFQMLTLNERAK